MTSTKDILKKLQKLEIRTKGLTKHVFSGEYHSAFKGKGMAFSEVREYHIGDEVRTIDWNVTARFNDPFVKVFEEERELTAMLIIDVSGSLDFGSTKSKRETIMEIAAVLSFSAITNNDKVGAIFVSDKVEKYIPAQKGRNHVMVILRELIEFKASSKETNLSEALKFLRNTQTKRCISFVISDFYDHSAFLESMRLSKKKHDVVAIKVTDKMENEMPDMGIIQVFNAETGKSTWINTSDEISRKKFTKNIQNKSDELANELLKSGIDFVSINTDQDYIPILKNLFKRRGA